tara:strand:- start:199 stop:462 length:264 start_codon:yes stop_codon:yes gene_type:complete
MDKVGKSLQEIREQTGWFIGLGGNWKYAIHDSSAEILINKNRVGNLPKERTSETAIAYPLSGILSHPEFEQYYPNPSKNTEVVFYGK